MKELQKIRHYSTYRISESGMIINSKGKRLAQFQDKDGYLRVGLYNSVGAKQFGVHRLVATQFIPNPENKETVNHIDGNKTNNDVSNLEWCTVEENMSHAKQNKLHARGSKQGASKLTEGDVIEIKAMLKNKKAFGLSFPKIGKMFGVSHQAIIHIHNGVNWAHI